MIKVIPESGDGCINVSPSNGAYDRPLVIKRMQEHLMRELSWSTVWKGILYKKKRASLRKVVSNRTQSARLTSVLVPRTSVTQTASTGTLASPTQLGRQVGLGDLLVKLGLVALSEDGDLGDGNLVEPGLDE